MSQRFPAQKTMKMRASQFPGGVAPQLSQFPGIGTDGLATAPVCDGAFHHEDPTSSEVEHFFAPPPDVDQSANSHRTEFFDISS